MKKMICVFAALALAVKNTGQAIEELQKAGGTMIGALEEVHTAEADVLRESAAVMELVQTGNE